MRTFELKKSIIVPAPIDEVFEFFSNARNLEKLTPPHVKFEIVDGADKTIEAGDEINYRIKVRGIPLKWRSLISVWEPPHRFVDEQLIGPYRKWHHEHSFVECEGGTEVRDVVHYSVWGGALINNLLVKRDLDKIFDYRHEVLEEIFGPVPV